MTRHDLPRWAPRVPQEWVRRFYLNDAKGLPDADLIDELAFGLLARCTSFLAAVDAVHGRARCPLCGREARHDHKTVECRGCDWSVEWKEYFSTIQKKQLSGAEPVLALMRDYCSALSSASDERAKTLLIDKLIHGWHYNQGRATRPVAVNLIEGRLTEVVEFLDGLTYGPTGTPSLSETSEEWRKQSCSVRRWMPQPKRRMPPRR